MNITIDSGTLRDYASLSAFHYCAGRPATICRVWRAAIRRPTTVGRFAQRRGEETVLGVLIVSMPVLNCRARRFAWPGRFEGKDRPAIAATINANVRTISRVIVDPRVRGIGLASRLVRHALNHATTPCTEAMATMGDTCGFFERAGMRRVDVPLAADDARLKTKLERIGVDPADLLAVSSCRSRLATLPTTERDALVRAAKTWRLSSGVRKRKLAHLADDDARLIARAALQLVCRPVYYAYEQSGVVEGTLDPDLRRLRSGLGGGLRSGLGRGLRSGLEGQLY